MIITFICFAILMIGMIFVGISKKARDLYIEERTNFVGWLLIVLSIAFIIFIVTFLIINTSTHDVEYQNMLHKREMLEYRIEHMEENITGNEMLYNDIVEFNNELRNTKKWANSLWTNWFNNQYIAAIDYIELEYLNGD